MSFTSGDCYFGFMHSWRGDLTLALTIDEADDPRFEGNCYWHRSRYARRCAVVDVIRGGHATRTFSSQRVELDGNAL